MLGLTSRQVRRLCRALEAGGPGGLVSPQKNVLLTSSFTGRKNYMMNFGKLVKDAEAMKHFGSTMALWDLKAMKPTKIFSVLSGATVEFPLVVTNRSNFPILISTITGSLSIAGSEVGTLSTGDLGNLQGRGTKQLALPLTLSFLSAGNAVMTAINGGNANLAFDARLVSGADQVPLKVDQWVNFVR